MYVCTYVHKETKRGHGTPGTGVIDGCCYLGSLEEKPVLIATEPSAQFQFEGILVFSLFHKKTILVYYIDDTLLTRQSEQEVATTLVTQMCIRGGGINLTKTQGFSTLVKFFRVQDVGHAGISLI